MLKATAKRVVGPKHWSFLSWYKNDFGAPSALWAYARLPLMSRGLFPVPAPVKNGKVFVRPGTSDQDVFDEIFVIQEYELDLGCPRFIVDAGAHIGLSAVYLAERYPEAVIVALEPEDANFELLCLNAKPYPNIRPIKAGLWSRKANLRIQNPGVETWSFRVEEDPAGQGIPALGVEDIMREFGVSRIDVLKMDIEGSEVQVFHHSKGWLGAVGSLIVELHDRFQPGCSRALEQALADFESDTTVSGEKVVITRMRPRGGAGAARAEPDSAASGRGWSTPAESLRPAR